MARESIIVWFRRDLRVEDNAALLAAVARGGAVVPVFNWSSADEGDWPPGAASRWWLHHSLAALADDVRGLGSRLILRRGRAAETLAELTKEIGAGAVFFNRRYEPAARQVEADVADVLLDAGVGVRGFSGTLLFEPDEVRTGAGGPYRVFTPFWKACAQIAPPGMPVSAPVKLSRPPRWPASLPLDELQLLPRIDWAGGLRETWRPGSAGARVRLEAFNRVVTDYETGRDQPAEERTSRLSPYLCFGEISPRQVWHTLRQLARRRRTGMSKGAAAFLRQLGWREFACHLLYHYPHTADEPLQPAFAVFPWEHDEEKLHAWQRGRTGYPWVDAGMRQLWNTGWMHNRVRMAAASFLVKDLRIDWRCGARWFWDTLVDADLANNTLGWQWTAGCGADAAPYFRVFNPVLQGKRFDAEGDYIRRWVPQLANCDERSVHEPWKAPAGTASILDDYPQRIVDHAEARDAALAAYTLVKQAGRKAHA